VVVTLLMNGGFDDPNPQEQDHSVTDQDIDPETTSLGKTFLHQNQVDQRLAFYLWADAQERLPADISLKCATLSCTERWTLAIGPLVKPMSEDVDQGRVAAYTVWLNLMTNTQPAPFACFEWDRVGQFPVGSDRLRDHFLRQNRICFTSANRGCSRFQGAGLFSGQLRPPARRLRVNWPLGKPILGICWAAEV